MSEHSVEKDAPAIYERFGQDLLGPWGDLTADVQEAWHELADKVAPESLGVRETAAMLGVHENTVRNWVTDGVLTDMRLPGTRHTRLHPLEVERLAAGRHALDIEAALVSAQRAIEALRMTMARAEAFLNTSDTPSGEGHS